MRSIFSVMIVMALLFTAAVAEGSPAVQTITFQANETTGYYWTGFVYGDSVRLSDERGVYVPEEADSGLCGVGGETNFTVEAVQPGVSVILFCYARGLDDLIEERFVRVYVSEDMTMTIEDTDNCAAAGTVLEVNEAERAALILTDDNEEIQLVFSANDALPVCGEHIRAYIGDMMTMSLPTVTEVIGWESVPTENARSFSVIPAASEFTFDDLQGNVFYFSSGVGAWYTELIVDEDGCFTGMFSDSEMGEDGAEYPNGSVYQCSFVGRFADPQAVNEYTVRLQLTDLTVDDSCGPEYIEDGTRYVLQDQPYGLEDVTELLLYLPGAPVSELPEGFLMWANMTLDLQEMPVLPCYGLYNTKDELGFFGDVWDTVIIGGADGPTIVWLDSNE